MTLCQEMVNMCPRGDNPHPQDTAPAHKQRAPFGQLSTQAKVLWAYE